VLDTDSRRQTEGLAGAVRQALAEAQESLATAATPTELQDFVEQYVGPMVLRPDGDVQRKETAPAEAGAETALADKTEPLHAGRVKRSLAGARYVPLHAIRGAFWKTWGAAA